MLYGDAAHPRSLPPQLSPNMQGQLSRGGGKPRILFQAYVVPSQAEWAATNALFDLAGQGVVLANGTLKGLRAYKCSEDSGTIIALIDT